MPNALRILTIAAAMIAAGASTAIAGDNVPVLPNGGTIAGLSGGAQWAFTARVYVPANQASLTVQTFGGIGDADIYVRYAGPAELGAWDASGTGPDNREKLVLSRPAAGWWYVTVLGRTGFAGLNLTARSIAMPPVQPMVVRVIPQPRIVRRLPQPRIVTGSRTVRTAPNVRITVGGHDRSQDRRGDRGDREGRSRRRVERTVQTSHRADREDHRGNRWRSGGREAPDRPGRRESRLGSGSRVSNVTAILRAVGTIARRIEID